MSENTTSQGGRTFDPPDERPVSPPYRDIQLASVSRTLIHHEFVQPVFDCAETEETLP